MTELIWKKDAKVPQGLESWELGSLEKEPAGTQAGQPCQRYGIAEGTGGVQGPAICPPTVARKQGPQALFILPHIVS